MVICRCLPHGYYGSTITLLATCGLISTLLGDRCNYSIVSDLTVVQELTANIIQIGRNTNTTIDVPFIQVGFDSYRIPVYYASTQTWVLEDSSTTKMQQHQSSSSLSCIAYPNEFHTIYTDRQWKLAKVFSFISLVLGGGGTLFLLCTTICTSHSYSWRVVGIELLLACIFQSASFIWFRTSICTSAQTKYPSLTNTTSTSSTSTTMNGTFFDNIATITTDMITTPTCTVSDGAKADIVAAILWFITSFLILVYYPRPRHMRKSTSTDTNDTNNEVDGLVVDSHNNHSTNRRHLDHLDTSTITRSMNTTSTCIGSTHGQLDNTSTRSIQTNNTSCSSLGVDMA